LGYQLASGSGMSTYTKSPQTNSFGTVFPDNGTYLSSTDTYYKIPQLNYYKFNSELEPIANKKTILPFSQKNADYVQMVSLQFSVMSIPQSQIHSTVVAMNVNTKQLIYEVPKKAGKITSLEFNKSSGNEFNYYLTNFQEEEPKPKKIATYNDLKITPHKIPHSYYTPINGNEFIIRNDGKVIVIVTSENKATFTLKKF